MSTIAAWGRGQCSADRSDRGIREPRGSAEQNGRPGGPSPPRDARIGGRARPLGAPGVFDIGALYAQGEADQSADDANLLEQRLDWHLQRPGDRREQNDTADDFCLDRVKQLKTWRRRLKTVVPVLSMLLGPKNKK